MVIPFVVPEILGGWNHPPDAIKLLEKADAINRWDLSTQPNFD